MPDNRRRKFTHRAGDNSAEEKERYRGLGGAWEEEVTERLVDGEVDPRVRDDAQQRRAQPSDT